MVKEKWCHGCCNFIIDIIEPITKGEQRALDMCKTCKDHSNFNKRLTDNSKKKEHYNIGLRTPISNKEQEEHKNDI